jgi:hypothetical protein
MSAHIVNDGSFTLVERRNLDSVQEEILLQLSGEISDESAADIGKIVGAETVLMMTVKPFGKLYRFTMRAVSVQSPTNQGIRNVQVKIDETMSLLTGREAGEAWKTKRFSLGLRGGASLHFYDAGDMYQDTMPDPGVSVDFAVQFGIQVHKYAALQIEAVVTADSMNLSFVENVNDTSGVLMYTREAKRSFNSRSLLIPLLVKATFKPDIFSLAPFGGAYLSLPLGKMEYTANGVSQDLTFDIVAGIVFGGSFGIHMGPGEMFFDIRYMRDLSETSVKLSGADIKPYSRSIALLGFGYAFFSKTRGGNHEVFQKIFPIVCGVVCVFVFDLYIVFSAGELHRKRGNRTAAPHLSVRAFRTNGLGFTGGAFVEPCFFGSKLCALPFPEQRRGVRPHKNPVCSGGLLYRRIGTGRQNVLLPDYRNGRQCWRRFSLNFGLCAYDDASGTQYAQSAHNLPVKYKSPVGRCSRGGKLYGIPFRHRFRSLYTGGSRLKRNRVFRHQRHKSE